MLRQEELRGQGSTRPGRQQHWFGRQAMVQEARTNRAVKDRRRNRRVADRLEAPTRALESMHRRTSSNLAIRMTRHPSSKVRFHRFCVIQKL